jgi:DNA-binding XRE family transcriptional regulator
MVERESDRKAVDPGIERLVRGLLRGSDGEVRLRFRVSGSEVSMEILGEDRPIATRSIIDQAIPFAAWMGDQLRARHLSQEATARILGVSLKTVNRWVNGRTEPRMRELRRIQEAFGAAPPL